MHASEYAVTVGATSQAAIASNPLRMALILSPPAAGRVTLSRHGTAVIDAGITLTAGMQPLRI